MGRFLVLAVVSHLLRRLLRGLYFCRQKYYRGILTRPFAVSAVCVCVFCMKGHGVNPTAG